MLCGIITKSLPLLDKKLIKNKKKSKGQKNENSCVELDMN